MNFCRKVYHFSSWLKFILFFFDNTFMVHFVLWLFFSADVSSTIHNVLLFIVLNKSFLGRNSGSLCFSNSSVRAGVGYLFTECRIENALTMVPNPRWCDERPPIYSLAHTHTFTHPHFLVFFKFYCGGMMIYKQKHKKQCWAARTWRQDPQSQFCWKLFKQLKKTK